jgi:Uma2 family endonuclease
MTALAKQRMTVDEYLAWAMDHPGRYELFQGEVFAMSPETVGHASAKVAIYSGLAEGIRRRGLACHAVPDGITVRVDDATAYEPDAQVYCGEKLPPTALEVPSPVIVVEVLSPSTRRIDVSTKLSGYFRLPSVAHYLIVDLKQQVIVHHARGSGDAILTRIIRDGSIALDPPGLELAVGDAISSARKALCCRAAEWSAKAGFTIIQSRPS